jgi:hypothetical protein
VFLPTKSGHTSGAELPGVIVQTVSRKKKSATK